MIKERTQTAKRSGADVHVLGINLAKRLGLSSRQLIAYVVQLLFGLIVHKGLLLLRFYFFFFLVWSVRRPISGWASFLLVLPLTVVAGRWCSRWGTVSSCLPPFRLESKALISKVQVTKPKCTCVCSLRVFYTIWVTDDIQQGFVQCWLAHQFLFILKVNIQFTTLRTSTAWCYYAVLLPRYYQL